MSYMGVVLVFIGFIMLLLKADVGSIKSRKNGGEVSTNNASELHQLEKYFFWIHPKFLRKWLIKYYTHIAFGCAGVGCFLQVVDLL